MNIIFKSIAENWAPVNGTAKSLGNLTKFPQCLWLIGSNKAEAQTGQTLHEVLWQVLKDVESWRDDSWIPSGHQVTFRVLSSLRGEIPWTWEFTWSTAIYKFPTGEGHCWTPELMGVKEYVSMRKLIRCLQKEDSFRETDLTGVNATVVTDGATLSADLSPWCIYVLVIFIMGNGHFTARSWLSLSVHSRRKHGVTKGHRFKSVWVRKETESLPLMVPWQGWASKLVASA